MFSIISFNAVGHQSLWLHRKREDTCRPEVARAADLFRRLLLDSPADFVEECEWDGLPRLAVTWQAVFETVGFVEFRFADNHLAATSLLLSGAHPASDRAAIDSAEGMLASNPGNTFRMAFSLIRKHGRPLAASFALAAADSSEKLGAIRLANEALAEAFFGVHSPRLMVGSEGETRVAKGA
jgi:hypothetical protein